MCLAAANIGKVAMRILFCSPQFSPRVGGIETVASLLVPEFIRLGHEVQVVTFTPSHDGEREEYEVWRRPAAIQLARLVRWSDVVFHHSISLRMAWPLLLMRRPWVVSHHGDYGKTMAAALKLRATNLALNISVSHSEASYIPAPSTVIQNPYDDKLFCESDSGTGLRTHSLVFLGRLSPEKGVDVLLRSLKILGQRGLRPKLKIIGSGPEEPHLQTLARELGVDGQVSFGGTLRGQALAEELRRHMILVAPSLSEAFGIVALEGMACGCLVVGSSGCGLGEAIGNAGLTFPNGDAGALSECLARLLTDAEERAALLARVPEHLRKFSVNVVAARYLEVLERAVQGGAHGRA
jgi:glycosyltransferase involved in cell wall biosynthesis